MIEVTQEIIRHTLEQPAVQRTRGMALFSASDQRLFRAPQAPAERRRTMGEAAGDHRAASRRPPTRCSSLCGERCRA
jgi:hypothetical protein